MFVIIVIYSQSKFECYNQERNVYNYIIGVVFYLNVLVRCIFVGQLLKIVFLYIICQEFVVLNVFKCF